MKKTITLLLIGISIQAFSQCFEKISAGDTHSAAIKTDGRLLMWGDNYFGQVGIGMATVADIQVPTQITNADWQEIAVGPRTSLGIKADGTLWAWGSGTGGSATWSLVPVQIGSDTNWQSVVTAGNHTTAIKTDGTLWSWGRNDYGQLGDGTSTNKDAPVQIGTATNWSSAAVGQVHTVAIKTDGTLWVWGLNGINGTFGDGTSSNSNIPKQVGTANNWRTVTTGSAYNLAIKTDGTLWESGYNQYDAAASNNWNWTIHQVGSDTNWQSIAAGDKHNLGIKTDGTLWAWGWNNKGQLGDGTTTNRSIPTQIGTGTDWQLVSAGLTYTIAMKNDGSVYTWGNNENGQLGDNTSINNSVPTAITCPATVVLAVADFTPANTMKLYPNPVKDVLMISFDTEITSVTIYNLLGQNVLTKSINTNKGEIDVSNLLSGTYLIRVTSNNVVKTLNFIKE